jgi:ABC-type transport system involved in multi-copper enzyme maturation permease subunit
MNWLIWRQHRKQFVALVIVLVLYAALVVSTGLHFWHTYQQALTTCGRTDTCDQLSSTLFASGWESNLNPSLGFHSGSGVNIVVFLIMALPFLLGMFVGAPLIAREYNEGTNLLIWTRSISRRRWLTAKLVWTLMATAVFAGVFAALTTWWSKTGNSLYANRFDTVKFDLQGIAPVAYAVFAVASGITLGTWLKRTLLAIGVMLAMLLALQIGIGAFLRPHYATPITVTASMTRDALDAKLPSGAWVVSRDFVDQHGRVSSQPFDLPDWPSRCQALATQEQAPVIGAHKAAAPSDIDNCLTAAGYHQIATYQPSYRYWNFQRIETGLYLGLTAAAVAATYWLVLKRDA